MILKFHDMRPKIPDSAFVAPTAVIIGDVVLGEEASIWYQTVLRGDTAPIRVGCRTNIQDNCTIHADPGLPAIIGDNVTVGHGAVVHGCIVENNCLIGIGAKVLNAAHVKTGSVVAAGAVVTQGMEVGPYELVAGVPAKVIKKLEPTGQNPYPNSVTSYLDLSRRHKAALGHLPGGLTSDNNQS